MKYTDKDFECLSERIYRIEHHLGLKDITIEILERKSKEVCKPKQGRKRELKRLQSPRLTSFKRKFVKANIGLGTKLIKGGKITSKFLGQAAKNIAEAERQEELAKRRRPKKRTSKKKTTSRRKTTKSKKSKRKKR